MRTVKNFLLRHISSVVLTLLILLCTLLPLFDIYTTLGTVHPSIVPTFTDENFYLARMEVLVHGHFTSGNPYFLEHADGPPLVIFAGVWVNATLLMFAIPTFLALYINFILWSLAFAAAAYVLLRELRITPWVGVVCTVFLYIESFDHVWRPVNMQVVYPFYFLFYFALARLIRKQNTTTILFLGSMIGATFYLLAYLWQVALVTMSILFVYAVVTKQTPLARAAFFSGLLGCVLGLPVPLYALWLSSTSPYFWESVYRLGLVHTHLPMAEVIYSGGWVGVVLLLCAFVYWRTPVFRATKEWQELVCILSISGGGLWITQGSNLFTGKLLETGEHVKLLMLPWFIFATASLVVFLWAQRAKLLPVVKIVTVIVLGVLSLLNVYLIYQHLHPFFPGNVPAALWRTEQLYAKPIAWLNEQPGGAVVWGNPYSPITEQIPLYTKDFVLYDYFGMLELVPEAEIRERYLVSQYFDNPSEADLSSDHAMGLYLGRHDFPHQAKTIERKVKVCRILFFWDRQKNCGVVPTPRTLLGEQFFVDFENTFTKDVAPHIKMYLKKYHVTYIFKDILNDMEYHPEQLGATRVYTDGRFEIYRL